MLWGSPRTTKELGNDFGVMRGEHLALKVRALIGAVATLLLRLVGSRCAAGDRVVSGSWNPVSLLARRAWRDELIWSPRHLKKKKTGRKRERGRNESWHFTGNLKSAFDFLRSTGVCVVAQSLLPDKACPDVWFWWGKPEPGTEECLFFRRSELLPSAAHLTAFHPDEPDGSANTEGGRVKAGRCAERAGKRGLI